MTWRWIFSLILVVTIPSVLSGQCESSTQGREFVFGILDTGDECCHSSTNIVALDITNVSPTDTGIRLQIPYLSKDVYFNISQDERKTIKIDPHIQKDGTFVDKRAIRITSDNDISVIVTNAYTASKATETYNILPVDSLGNKYIISSFRSNDIYNERGSVFLVAGVHDNTRITLHNQTSQIYAATISSTEVFQYLCQYHGCDLTGVRVVSDKNIFVVSGSSFVSVPYTWDVIASAMIPTSAMSNRYIVPPALPKRSFMIRVLSEYPLLNTTIASTSQTININGIRTEHYFQNETVVVVADQPFSVTQYGVSKLTVDDAFMTIVPGVDQYLNDYIFTVPHGYYGVKHNAAIIVQAVYKDGLLFDGASWQSYKYPVTVLNVPQPLDDYIVLMFQVHSGFHHFRQIYPAGNFGLFVYAVESMLGSGFYAGFNLKGDCFASTQTSFEPTTVTSRNTSPIVYTPPTNMASNGSGQLCFVCADLSHLGLCDRVEQCNHIEVCYLERYVESGHTKYKSGCMDTHTCQTKEDKYSHSEDDCFECCNASYCNNKGCGEDIPARDRRGPICFDCEHISSPEECFKVFKCNSDQVCRTEEYNRFGHSNFKMGCGQGLCDPVQRGGGHRLKRATPLCLSCCTEDFCNRNCTRSLEGQGGSIIVG